MQSRRDDPGQARFDAEAVCVPVWTNVDLEWDTMRDVDKIAFTEMVRDAAAQERERVKAFRRHLAGLRAEDPGIIR